MMRRITYASGFVDEGSMNDRFDDGFDCGQGMALLAEAQSFSNLLRDGVEAILKLRHPQMQGDTVFTLASIGVEKLMKIVPAQLFATRSRWGNERVGSWSFWDGPPGS
jgi:hypothetical protein